MADKELTETELGGSAAGFIVAAILVIIVFAATHGQSIVHGFRIAHANLF
jgi:hypothetical protein